jgi:hypothetical protein
MEIHGKYGNLAIWTGRQYLMLAHFGVTNIVARFNTSFAR